MTAKKPKAYATGTKTDISTTETQIKRMLMAAGADGVAMMEQRDKAIVAFHLSDRAIQFRLPLPTRDDERFTYMMAYGRHKTLRSPDAAAHAWTQACRERWRALHLCIKAKLESIEQGIETFDDAFLAHIQTPDGETVGDKMRKELPRLLDGKPLRPLLGGS